MDRSRTPLTRLARVWVPALAIGALLIAVGLAEGFTGIVFVAACVAGTAYAYSVAARSNEWSWGVLDLGPPVALFTCIAVLLLADGKARDGVNVPRLTLFVIGAMVLAIVGIARLVQSRARPRLPRGLEWALLALVLVTLASAILGMNPRLSFLGASGSYDGVLLLTAGVVVLLVTSRVASLLDVRAFLVAFFLSAGAPIAFYALLQFRDRLFATTFDWLPAPTGFGSTLGNANHLGAFIALVIPLGVALALTERARRLRWGWVALLGVFVVVLFLCDSEGALVATVGAVAVFALAAFGPGSRRVRIPSGVQRAVAILVPLAVTAVFVAARPLLERLSSSMLGPEQTSTVGQRFALWRAGIDMMKEQPLLGSGPDTYRLLFPSYQGFDFVQSFGPTELANGAHNIFFNQLATTGVLGLIALIGLIVVVYPIGWGALRRTKALAGEASVTDGAREARLYTAALIAAITAYLLQASFNVQQVALSFAFWLLVGLLVAVARDLGVPASLDPGRLMAADVPVSPQRVPRSKKDRRAATGLAALPLNRNAGPSERADAPALVVVALLTALAVALAFVAVRPYRGARRAYEATAAFSVISPDNPIPVEQRFELLDESADLYGEAFRINPWEYSYARAAGNSEFLYGVNEPQGETALVRMKAAQKWYARAQSLHPRDPEMLLAYSKIMSELYSQTGDPRFRATAVELIRLAFQINPWDAEVGARLVSVVNDLGSLPEAKRLLARALRYRPDDKRLRELAEDLNVPLPNSIGR